MTTSASRRMLLSNFNPDTRSEVSSSFYQRTRTFKAIMAFSVQNFARIMQFSVPFSRSFHQCQPLNQIQLLTRLRVVDNSPIGKEAMIEGRPPKCIHVYNPTRIGRIGDKVLVAIKGQKKKAVIVGLKQKQSPFIPKFDSNNIVLIEDNGSPIGTRIHVPVPSILRKILKERSVAKKIDFTKLLSICTKFV
uniref:Large ribosomal subunit protein uL14m n=1 Tax=Daphnia galeata TaxID=27404 RepID=A0A8J2S449_9CRUS|nr:unnamed protein product [Daphnia galeata]